MGLRRPFSESLNLNSFIKGLWDQNRERNEALKKNTFNNVRDVASILKIYIPNQGKEDSVEFELLLKMVNFQLNLFIWFLTKLAMLIMPTVLSESLFGASSSHKEAFCSDGNTLRMQFRYANYCLINISVIMLFVLYVKLMRSPQYMHYFIAIMLEHDGLDCIWVYYPNPFTLLKCWIG